MSEDKLELTTMYADEFEEDIRSIDDEIATMEALYDEIKSHYDDVRTTGRSTLTFIEKQTTNLISLRAHKLNLLKQKLDVKNTIIDLGIKSSKLDMEKDSNTALNQQLFEMITNQEGISSPSTAYDIEVEDVDDELEDILAERGINPDDLYTDAAPMESEPIDVVVEDEDDVETHTVVDMTGTRYVINDEGEIIKTLEPLTVMDVLEVDGITTLKLSDDQIYELVEIDD